MTSHIKNVALFSAYETEMVNHAKMIHQIALAVKIDEALPDSFHSSRHDISQPAIGLEHHPDVSRETPYLHSDVVELLEEWVRSKQHSYCALLGEYGMGKTMTCMRFTQTLLKKRETEPDLPLPIYLDLRNLSDKNKVHEMDLVAIITSILYNRIEAGYFEGPSFQAADIIRLVQEEKALVIFDGLDEVLVRVSPSDGHRFTRQLLSILPPDRLRQPSSGQVLVTCRTHYFRTIRDQKMLFTSGELSGIHAEDYRVLTLLPFTPPQIYEYLKRTLPDVDTDSLVRLIQSVHNLSELAERPYTLSLIPSLIPQIEHWKKESVRITGITIYRHIVLSWLERDTGKHRLTIDHKQQLMEHFAAELWRSGKRAWDVSDVESWFVQFVHARPALAVHYVLGRSENTLYLVLEAMKEDLRTATFLVRVGESNFCFAHTSLQEYFLATYLYRALIERRFDDWDMPIVSQETLDFLGQLLSEYDSPEAMENLRVLRDAYRPKISELLFAYALVAHKNEYPVPAMTGIRLDGARLNEWSIKGRADKPFDLRNASFKGANLTNAMLRYLRFDQADFTEAHLNNAKICDSQAPGVSFAQANLVECTFADMSLRGAIFENAVWDGGKWVRCDLENVQQLDPAKFSRCIFVQCKPEFGLDHKANHLDHNKAGHSSMLSDCAFSFDGRYLVSAAWDETLRIWDVRTGACLSVLRNPGGIVRGCVFSSDGRRVFFVGGDNVLRVWDTVTGECLKGLQKHQDSIRKCAISLDGKFIVSAAKDKTLRIWDVNTGECLHVFEGHEDGVRSCALSPDGLQLISVSDDTTIRVWNTATGECVRVLTDHDRPVYGCAFSPDGQKWVSASFDKTARIWNAATGECLNILSHENKVRECAFSPDGHQLVTVSDDCDVRIWDTQTGKSLKVLGGHLAKAKCCAYSPCGRYLASGAEDCSVRVWDAKTGECVHVLGGQ